MSNIISSLFSDLYNVAKDDGAVALDESTGNDSTAQAAQDFGALTSDSAQLFTDLSGGVATLAQGLGLTGTLASSLGDLASANQAMNQYAADQDSSLAQTDPDLYQQQLQTDLNQLMIAEGDMFQQSGLLMTLAGAPQAGLLLSVVGLGIGYIGQGHDPNFMNQILNQIGAYLSNGGDDDPPGGATGGASNDADGLMGDGSNEIDPVVLDITGNGLNLTSLGTSPTYFDFANNGFAQRTSWVGPGTGVLCIDPTGADITNGTQLIESFAELQQLAGGIQSIDSSNPLYDQLRVWVAAGAEGNAAGSGELFTLSQLGIESINLQALSTDQTFSGNTVTATSSYTLADGTTREIASVSLVQNPTDTVPDTTIEIPADIASLPQVAGAGTLLDLQSAMVGDSSLLAMMQAFVALPSMSDYSTIASDVQSIMYQWAGVANVDPTSRGMHVDARQLDFAEAYLGQQFNSQFGSNPIYHAGPDVSAAWNDLYTSVFAQLVLQSPNLASLVPEFQYVNGAVFAVQSLGALQSAYARLGDLSITNAGEWEIVLRVADAYRMEVGLSLSDYEGIVALETSDAIGSLANAIASNLQVSFSGNGGIVETGTPLNDTFYAGQGISLLVGNGGGETFDDPTTDHDTFVYNSGDGSVEINELDSLALSPTNTLQLGAGISASSVNVSTENGNIVLTLSTGDTITLDGMASNSNDGVQLVTFADGTTWSRGQVLAQAGQAAGATRYDYLVGTSGADLMDGGSGDIFEVGNGGNDTFVFDSGYGHLEIDEVDPSSAPDNILQFGAGITPDEVVVSSDKSGDVILMVGANGDRVEIDNMLSNAADGVQQIEFADGTSWNLQDIRAAELQPAGAGTNDLYGTGAPEYFDGKGGDDFEFGGGGGDTFVFNKGYGDLEINEYEPGSAINILRLGVGIDESSIVVRADDLGDLILTDGTPGDSIQLDAMFSTGNAGVQEVQFADGTIWTRQQLIQEETIGNTGNDTLYGTSAPALFDGKGGNDLEVGYSGEDTFVFNAGYGQLEINESDDGGTPDNVLKLGAGISEMSLKAAATQNGSGLILTDGIPGDQITLDNMLSASPGSANGIQQVQFADGTVWTAQQLVQLETTGTTGNDTLYGSNGADLFDGRGGDDFEIGNGGNDTFIFNQGYGKLNISEQSSGASQQSVLQLGAGILPDEVSVTVDKTGGDVVLTIGSNGDQITLDNMAYAPGSSGVQKVQFADGTVWTASQVMALAQTIQGTTGNDTLYGSDGADTFDGKGGDDLEVGNGGNDTFIFNQGYGQLEIDEYSGPNALPGSELELGAGITPDEVSASADSNGDIILTIGTNGDQIKLDGMATGAHYGIQQVQFADGTVWTASQVLALAGNVQGTTGNDTLYGTDGADTFDGKGGNDLEVGNGGNDTFIFNQGYGQLEIDEDASGVLQLGAGITPDEVSASLDGKNILLTIGSNGDQVTLDNMAYEPGAFGVQQVQFADGTVWTASQILSLVSDIEGTTGNDTLYGTGGADYFDGHGGDDIEIGNGGNDTFVFNQGYGQLEINEYSGSWSTRVGTLELGAGITPSSIKVTVGVDNGIVLTIGSNGDQVTLDNMDSSWGGYGVQQVQFADGTVWTASQMIDMATNVQGTTGNDTLYGTTGADVFDGKGGNDLEVGNGGDDTFIFNQGYGHLEISEYGGYGGTTGVLQLGAGIAPSSVSVMVDSEQDVVLTIGTNGDQVRLDSMADSEDSAGVAEVQFADGTVWTASQIMARVSDIEGTTGNDVLVGWSDGDLFDGKGGNDVETGFGANDTFIFNAGYGHLEIDNESYPPNDVLRLGPGINESSLTAIATSNNGVVLTDGISGDQITLDNELASWGGVQQIQFADGTTWTQQQLLQRLTTTGTTGDDTLYGGPLPADFDGKGGNDYEQGSGTGDTFIFNAGYGHLEINESTYSRATNVLQLGAGINESSVTVTATSNYGVVLTDGISGDQITLDNALYGGGDGVQEVQFADGTIWSQQQLLQMAKTTTGTPGNDVLIGGSAATLLDGKGGNDYEQGGGNGDTFIFDAGYGHLEINENANAGATNVLQLGAGIYESSVTVSATKNNGVVLTDGTSGDQITLDNALYGGGDGVQEVQFADGTTWSQQQLLQMAMNTTGTPGDDVLIGGSAPAVFDGKGGNDYEQGGGNGDTFIFNAGYGHLEINENANSGATNVLQLGAGISEWSMTVSVDSNQDILLTEGTDQIQLDGMADDVFGGSCVQQVQFADGKVWSANQIVALASHVQGTTGNDTLYGTTGPNTFDGKGGNDVEIGDGDNDTFIFNQGYGHLEIQEGYDPSDYGPTTNVLQLGAGIAPSSLIVTTDSSGDILLTSGTDQVQIDGMNDGRDDTVQEVQFADGTVWTAAQVIAMATDIEGTTGNDTLYGTSAANTFDGHGGNDVEIGGGGNDTFVFNQGYGHLEIDESDSWNGTAGKLLQLGAGITASAMTVSLDSKQDILLTEGTDQIQIDGMADGSGWNGVGEVQFADGTVWAANQLIAMARDITGTTGNDTLYGTNGDDIFDGKGGNDLEIGNGGNDTFIFNAGYRHLEINETNFAAGATSVLQLGQGISESSVTVAGTSNGALVLTDGISGDQITLDNGLYGDNYGVQQVQFADGTTWSEQQLLQMATTGASANESLYGTPSSDVFDSEGGADTEYGNGGNDTYILQPGYSPVTVVNGIASNNVAAGDLSIAGVNPDDIWLQQVGNDLLVDIMGSTTEATIKNWFSNTYSQLGELTVSGGTGGNMTLDTQINQLIQAMATFSANNPGFDPTSPGNPVITDPTLLATVNSAWHQ